MSLADLRDILDHLKDPRNAITYGTYPTVAVGTTLTAGAGAWTLTATGADFEHIFAAATPTAIGDVWICGIDCGICSTATDEWEIVVALVAKDTAGCNLSANHIAIVHGGNTTAQTEGTFLPIDPPVLIRSDDSCSWALRSTTGSNTITAKMHYFTGVRG